MAVTTGDPATRRLVACPRWIRTRSRSAAPGWPGAKSEHIGHMLAS